MMSSSNGGRFSSIRRVRCKADAIELADVLACEDGPDPGHLRGSGRVQSLDAPLGDRRANRHGVKHPGKVEIRRVCRRAADLKRPVNSGKVAADQSAAFYCLLIACSLRVTTHVASGSLRGKRECVLDAALRQFDLEAVLALRRGPTAARLRPPHGTPWHRGAPEQCRFRLV